jgi:hypothetical protein
MPITITHRELCPTVDEKWDDVWDPNALTVHSAGRIALALQGRDARLHCPVTSRDASNKGTIVRRAPHFPLTGCSSL